MKFSFTSKTINSFFTTGSKLISLLPAEDGSSDWIVLTSNNEVLRFDSNTQDSKTIFKIQDHEIPKSNYLQMVVGDNCDCLAITGSSNTGEDEYNWGHVFDMNSGKALLKIDCGDYYVSRAPFPVAFANYENQRLVVHATDWNRLDVTDLDTFKCLTERSEEPRTDTPKKDIPFTEWSGELLLSPNQKMIATIGWAWHPAGQAFTWSFENWIKENPAEADSGNSKKIHACWPYFWHGPFQWIDDERICIWGYDGLDIDSDYIPEDSAAIYNVLTGQLIHYFKGPTMDLFEIDQFLFSGGKKESDLSIWDFETGELLFQEEVFKDRPLGYNSSSRTFASYSETGDLTLTSWSLG